MQVPVRNRAKALSKLRRGNAPPDVPVTGSECAPPSGQIQVEPRTETVRPEAHTASGRFCFSVQEKGSLVQRELALAKQITEGL